MQIHIIVVANFFFHMLQFFLHEVMQVFSVVQILERIVAKVFLSGCKSSYIIVANFFFHMLQSFLHEVHCSNFLLF